MRYFLIYTKVWKEKKRLGQNFFYLEEDLDHASIKFLTYLLIDFLIRLTNIKYLLLKEDSKKKSY